MRWFTLDWWRGETDDEADERMEREYAEHLRRIRQRLPSGLLELVERGGLHDAHVKRVTVTDREVTMLLQAVAPDGGPRLPLELRYAGVLRFETTTDVDKALRGPDGYGDLGYHEVDETADGVLVHRLLFSSSIEIDVYFTAFSLIRDVVADSATGTAQRRST